MDNRIKDYFLGKLTKTERIALLNDILADASLKQEWTDFRKLQTLVSLSSQSVDKSLGEEKYKQFKHQLQYRKQKRLWLNIARYAAIAAMLIISTSVITAYFMHSEMEALTANEQIFHAPAGQRAELTLPDGSKVYLNAGSTLTYPSVFDKERRVKLSGEGFFEVAKNKNKPFIVSTKTIDIQAIGTQFNVFCYPNAKYATVYLKEGKVKAYFPSNKNDAVIMEPNYLLTQRGNTLQINNMGYKEQLWLNGIYEFKSEKLGDIVEKLELYYDVDIIIKDKTILNYIITGKFRQRDGIMEILRIIQNVHNFKIAENRELNQITLTL